MAGQSTLRSADKLEQESRKKIEQIWPPAMPFKKKKKHAKKSNEDSDDDDNGSPTRAAIIDAPNVPLGEAIAGISLRFFTIGNRQIGGRSMDGDIFYAALYTVALGEGDIEHNAVRLMADDDP